MSTEWGEAAGTPGERTTAPPQRSGKAVAALVLGIAGLLVAPIVCSSLAIIFGVLARRDMDREPSLTGRGLATAGVALGVVGLALGALWLLVFL